MSSHDALNDDRLSKEVVVTTEEIEAKQRLREVEEKKKQELKANLAWQLQVNQLLLMPQTLRQESKNRCTSTRISSRKLKMK